MKIEKESIMQKQLIDENGRFSFETTYDKRGLIDSKIQEWEKKFKGSVGISYEAIPKKIKISARKNENPVDPGTIEYNEVDGFEIIVKVEIPTLKHEGWEYLATIEKIDVVDEKENVVGTENIVFSKEDTKNRFTNLIFRCDHCNTNHFRKIVHVFVNGDQEKIIGSACVKEYFGINAEYQLKKILDFWGKIDDLVSDFEGSFGGGRGHRCFDKLMYSKLCYGIIKKMGKYVSRSSCGDFSDKVPTSAIVSNMMNATIQYDKEMVEERRAILESFPEFDFLKIKEYWMSKEDDSDFIHNVQLNLRMLEPKMGFLAYAVFGYMEDVEDFSGKKKMAALTQNSEYVGNVGDKIKDKEVTILKTKMHETMYGVGEIFTFIDESGNIMTWFSSTVKSDTVDVKAINDPEHAIIEGNKVKIKGSIKDCKEYNGKKTTYLTRVKFI